MKRVPTIFLQAVVIVSMAVLGPVMASEHPACHIAYFNHQDQSALALRAIADSCKDNDVARLYYNRAYHRDLLAEGRVLSALIRLNGESDYQLEAYRLYIALIEELAPLYYPQPKQRLEFLNRVYERRNEVAELRLHGYDALADVLERKLLY